MDEHGGIAIVHNGIIENYYKLKTQLIAKGYRFVSDTDTEVVVHLLDYNYEGDMLKALCKTLNMLEGSYALAIINSDYPDNAFLRAQRQPDGVRQIRRRLFRGVGRNGVFGIQPRRIFHGQP
jgi:glucosamine--fructose-6-phosphate aminotransferase (isomerizing)